jgi:putative transposase
MTQAYSKDLRERVVGAVERGEMSRRQAAAHYGVGISTAIKWVQRLRRTGSVEAGKIGGYRPKKLMGRWRLWLLERCRNGDFTLRGLVGELAERGLKVNYRVVWEFVHAEGFSHKKRRWSPANRTAPMWRAGARSGCVTATGSILHGWSSSMRPGPRQTWHRCVAGRRAVKG